MSENKTNFYDWQRAKKTDYVRFRSESPNLRALVDALIKRWGGTNVGIFAKRPIRHGTSPSSHSFGAALDWRYGDTVGHRQRVVDEVLPWLVENSEELGIQAIHDYYGCSIWRSVREDGKRGWKPQAKKNEMGASWARWLHIETTKTDWGNDKRVDERLG